MPTRPQVSKLVTASVAPLLRERGFARSGLTFRRRLGGVEQVLSVQLGRGGAAFYVNVGLVFDAVAALDPDDAQVVIGGRPVHHAARLHELVEGAPAEWDAGDASAGAALRRGLEAALPRLDRVDGPAGMLAAFPLENGFEKVLRAQLKWVTGDRAGARADLELVAREFSDRRGCTPRELASRAGLR